MRTSLGSSIGSCVGAESGAARALGSSDAPGIRVQRTEAVTASGGRMSTSM